MTVARAFQKGERPTVHFQHPDRRAALAFDGSKIVTYLVTLLRRQWR